MITKLTAIYQSRLIKSLGVAASAFYLMKYHFNYYNDPLPIHLSWIALQVTLGTGLSAAFFLLNKGRGGNSLKIIGR